MTDSPISRDDLTDEKTVLSLRDEARESVTGNDILATTALIYTEYGTDGNVTLSDVATALQYHCNTSIPKRYFSLEFTNRIARENQ